MPDRLHNLAPAGELTTNLRPSDDVVSHPGPFIALFGLTHSSSGGRMRDGELGAF